MWKNLKKWLGDPEYTVFQCQLKPKEDITPYELARIISLKGSSMKCFEALPLNYRKHLQKYKLHYQGFKLVKAEGVSWGEVF